MPAPVKMTPPAAETKEQKSVRLATARMPKTLSALDGIRRLASSNYSFTEKQKVKIVTDLEKAVASVRKSFFDEKSAEPEAGYSLD